MINKLLILTLYLFTVYFVETTQASNSPFKVVIDAGHGGKDGGCVGRFTKEKDLNLNIALRIGSLIESNHKDVKVIYTRKTDIFVPLIRRTEIANEHKADLFISIHADAIPKSKNTASAFGVSTFTLGAAKTEENLEIAKRENAVIIMEDDYKASYQGFDPSSTESYIMFEILQSTHQTQSIQLASMIQHELKHRAKRHDRQVRQGPYLVLKTASMPAVLVEVGFLSNTQEEQFLSTNDGKDKVARSIYHGFAKYKEAYDRHNQTAQNTTAISRATPAANQRTNSTPAARATSTNSTSSAKNSNGDFVYKVQFLSYHKKLPKGATQLKGLWPVESYVENGTHRHTFGSTTDFNEAVRMQKQVRLKFKDAFVIRYKDGKRLK